MERNCTPASPATALASRVLPVPGGPTSSTPLGMRAPRAVNFWGSRRNSTISRSSSFSSSAPATSSKVTFFPWSDRVRVRARLNRAAPGAEPPPPALLCRIIRYQNRHSTAAATR